jgi:hypothetical protein
MTNIFSIRLKAVFLLTVFALNTVIGFACAIGVNMVFNSNHHHGEAEETGAVAHVHADGKRHIHQEEAENHKPHHHHNDVANHKHSNSEGGCCNDKVIKFGQLDKATSQNLAYVSPVFFTAFVSVFYNTGILYLSRAAPSLEYFARGHHPPIPDIRIAIQSFQI